MEDVAVECRERPLSQLIFDYPINDQATTTLKDEDYGQRIFGLDDYDPVFPTGVEDCGMKMTSKSSQVLPRIHGGLLAEEGAHPWQASIRVGTRQRSFHWCGATVLSHFHVITAAHCLRDFDKNFYFVRVGDHSLGKLIKQVVHPVYKFVFGEKTFKLG